MVEMKDLLGLAEPLTKLVEVIGCGIGKAYEPTHIKRMAKAKAFEIKTIGGAFSDTINFPITYDDGKVQINSTDFDALVKRTGSRLAFQEIQKQQNIESVIAKTYAELENEPPVSDEPVDKDWILRFFNSIEDISNEEMQKLWGKILAGEIKQPKSVSSRTLDVVKNLSADEARLFEDICKLGFKKDFPVNPYLDIMKNVESSQDCGLMQPFNTPYPFHKARNTYSTLLNGKYSIILAKTPHMDQGSVVPVLVTHGTLTKAGKELYEMLDIPFDYEYCCDYLKQVNTTQEYFKLSLHEIENIDDETGLIKYNETDLLS